MKNNLSNIILNTKPVADSFVNDQLKERRERIEKLTRQLFRKNKDISKLKLLYKNEVGIVDLLNQTLKLIRENTTDKDLAPMLNKVIKTTEAHIKNNKELFKQWH
jgi:hypothetical protein